MDDPKRKTRCCFTGHRPYKLSRPEDDIKVDLEKEILATIQDGFTTFLTGMACGTDIWAGNIVLRLKRRYPQVRLIAVVPFPEVSARWEPEWQEAYERLLYRADLVKIIAPEYVPKVYEKRNRWMIDRSSRMIAVYAGQPGGTQNAIRYARVNQVQVKYLAG